MNENPKEKNIRSSLFSRIKDAIIGNSAKEEAEENSETSEQPEKVQETPPHESRGVISVPENSLLYSLWKESVDAHESGLDALGEMIPETLELTMEDDDDRKIPMTTEQLEEEKQYATVKLMIQASKRHKLTRPGRDDIAPNVNAGIYIYVARNAMAAWALIFPPSGDGTPLQETQLRLALVENSVVFGVDEAAIARLVKEQPYFQLVLVACGTPMIPGEDGRVIDKFERNPEKTFGVMEDGSIDFREQNRFQVIHKGDIICEAVAPTKGTDGINVSGKVVPAKEGAPVKFPAGQNTTVDDEKNLLLASMDGTLKFEHEKFHVKPVLHIPGSVDLNTGNIDFLGDVHIGGDIREGFIVKATGSVTVGGSVEGAIIEAGKDLNVSGGILGDEKAVLKCGGNVRAQYIENSILYALGNVSANSIISSYIYSDGEITVRSGRGTVIGGKLVASTLIDARIVGCRSERQTTLVVGELPYVKQKKEELTSTLRQITEEKDELEHTIQFISENADDDPKKMQTAADFRLRQSILTMQISHINRMLDELTEKEVDVQKCRIKLDTVYPFTKIHIQDFSYTIDEQASNYRIHLGDDGILLN